MNLAEARIIDSGARADAAPELSILIPFHGDDPRPLIARLEDEASLLGGAVEIVLLDDGNPEQAVSDAVQAAVSALACPARLIRLTRNEGRSKGRNRLTAHARGGHLLFLDSDMAPDRTDFLGRWLDAVRADVPVAFGGFTVDGAPVSAATALHQALSRRADCLPAAVRARTPEKYVFTSNLLVRRDVFDAERFDEQFQGWGWEDVEWGMRVARRWPVAHIDNTATHLGLDTAESLARKYEQSAANFARVLAVHPEVVRSYPSFKVARILRLAPLRGVWRPLLKRLLVSTRSPLGLRIAAAKTYRAALYAEVV
jgi:glycosyltransferase involved in cell wall biosynthesis